MAGNPLLSGVPAVPLVGIVQNPASLQNPDMSVTPAAFGRNGQMLIDSVHGQYYSAASRGNVFVSSTLIAGVTVPVPATTLASKAGIRNPVGSGKNVELIGLAINSVTIEVALKNFQLEFQINASATGGVPTSITDLTAYSMPLGQGSMASVAKAYTAATMTNAAANPIIMPLFGQFMTAVGFSPSMFLFKDFPVVFGPDTVMCVTVNTTAIAAINFTYLWAEWPV